MNLLRLLIPLTIILYETQNVQSTTKSLKIIKSLLLKHFHPITEEPIVIDDTAHATYDCHQTDEGEATPEWNAQSAVLANDEPVLIEIDQDGKVEVVGSVENVETPTDTGSGDEKKEEIIPETIPQEEEEVIAIKSPETSNEANPEKVYGTDTNTAWLLGENTSEKLPVIIDDTTATDHHHKSIKEKIREKINLIKSKLEKIKSLSKIKPSVETITEHYPHHYEEVTITEKPVESPIVDTAVHQGHINVEVQEPVHSIPIEQQPSLAKLPENAHYYIPMYIYQPWPQNYAPSLMSSPQQHWYQYASNIQYKPNKMIPDTLAIKQLPISMPLKVDDHKHTVTYPGHTNLLHMFKPYKNNHKVIPIIVEQAEPSVNPSSDDVKPDLPIDQDTSSQEAKPEEEIKILNDTVENTKLEIPSPETPTPEIPPQTVKPEEESISLVIYSSDDKKADYPNNPIITTYYPQSEKYLEQQFGQRVPYINDNSKVNSPPKPAISSYIPQPENPLEQQFDQKVPYVNDNSKINYMSNAAVSSSYIPQSEKPLEQQFAQRIPYINDNSKINYPLNVAVPPPYHPALSSPEAPQGVWISYPAETVTPVSPPFMPQTVVKHEGPTTDQRINYATADYQMPPLNPNPAPYFVPELGEPKVPSSGYYPNFGNAHPTPNMQPIAVYSTTTPSSFPGDDKNAPRFRDPNWNRINDRSSSNVTPLRGDIQYRDDFGSNKFQTDQSSERPASTYAVKERRYAGAGADEKSTTSGHSAENSNQKRHQTLQPASA